jgi:hypothetical protein
LLTSNLLSSPSSDLELFLLAPLEAFESEVEAFVFGFASTFFFFCFG